jgi:hypothetical protein
VGGLLQLNLIGRYVKTLPGVDASDPEMDRADQQICTRAVGACPLQLF